MGPEYFDFEYIIDCNAVAEYCNLQYLKQLIIKCKKSSKKTTTGNKNVLH